MTREEFIEVLDEYHCRYILDDGKIILNSDYALTVRFPEGSSITPGVIFDNRGFVYLYDIISIPPGVEFNNSGEIVISPLFRYGNGYLKHQQFHIDGIKGQRLFNHMISKGLFR